MKKNLFIGIILLIFLTSCKKEPELSAFQMSEIAELGTVEYTISKVVKVSDDTDWYKFGDRMILFTCKATLKAGIDLDNIDEQKMNIDKEKKSITITLPNATLLSLNMKPEDVKLCFERTSLTRFKFSSTERNLIVAQGEKDILAAVPNLGILKDAEKNAKDFFEALLKQAGYQSININFEK